MKHNWEYKRLGDVCDFIGGGTPSKSNEEYYNGNIPWATVRDMLNFKLSETELCITEDAVKNSATNILPKGMIVISTHVGLGKICELMQDTAINQDLKGISFSSNSIDKYFFVYWYRSIADFIISRGRGATVKGVTLDFMKGLNIPVPPREVQEQIVAELDKINEVIEDCRELLRNLDALERSLFYDYFGDPNSATKFPKKPFGDIAINYDSKRRPVTKKDRIAGIYPYYGASGVVDYVSQYIFDGSFLLISEDGANLVARTQPIAFKANGKSWINNHAHVVDFENSATHLYMMYYFNLLDLHDKITGATLPKLTQKALNEIEIAVPPLSLQEEFAGRIERIEEQKKGVERTIAELRTLLDSRMDYWFN